MSKSAIPSLAMNHENRIIGTCETLRSSSDGYSEEMNVCERGVN